ncbi:MAG: protein kinase [Deltaproteobacteria bacterium]|nr:protein kinase [Deltaproteobacteria bacterium]MDQ3299103.1 protein kinase [Myxococcota bacterium]
MSGNSDEPAISSVDELLAAGRHLDAARAASELGDHGRAADLYEKLWDFRSALGAARAAGDLARALRYAIEIDDTLQIHELLTALGETPEGARASLDVLAKMRRHAMAAEIAERIGDISRAIDHYTRAHDEINAARLLEKDGRDREAGRLLERALDLAAVHEKAPLQLALGRILARRGAYPEAARLLQGARDNEALRKEAQRHLVAVLAAMGLRDGARDTLLELRAQDPEIPADLDSYLRAWRDEVTERKVGGRDREIIAGRYRIDRLLGAGASGRVFLATDEVAGRSVAIKMFFAAGARGGAAYERFVREARLASTLRHPSLVEVYDVSVERGFLVMEYLPGGSLQQRLAIPDGSGRLPPVQVRRMVLDIIGGLEAAHHRGVVHRDVKPANIFFDARGTAKLGDFGVAHLVDLGQTQTGGLIGTLAYMSPEQITGAPISIAADLYSVGVTLFEAVTGRLPFLGPDFVAQHLGEPAPAPSTVAADVALGWDPILEGLLVKNPRERTPTLGDLRRQLETLDLGSRSVIGLRPRRDSRPHSIAQLAAEDEVKLRYQFETPLGATPISQLARAVDTVLDRSVVIERFDTSDEATRALERARMLGRAQSPYVQRALGLDWNARSAVFEAPSGASFADAPPQLPGAEVVRLLKRLARAAAAIHEVGGSHGAIGPRTVVLDDGAVPTVMAAGLGPVNEATQADDVAAIIALVAQIAECDPSFDVLVRELADEVGAAVPTYAPPFDGESLYTAADALDIAVLAALGSR